MKLIVANSIDVCTATRACWLRYVMSILPCVFSRQPADVYTFAGEMVSPSELECPLPPSPLSNASDSAVYTWKISVSNDGQSYSNQLQLTVYDSKCLECDCSGQCQLKVCNVLCLRPIPYTSLVICLLVKNIISTSDEKTASIVCGISSVSYCSCSSMDSS